MGREACRQEPEVRAVAASRLASQGLENEENL